MVADDLVPVLPIPVPGCDARAEAGEGEVAVGIDGLQVAGHLAMPLHGRVAFVERSRIDQVHLVPKLPSKHVAERAPARDHIVDEELVVVERMFVCEQLRLVQARADVAPCVCVLVPVVLHGPVVKEGDDRIDVLVARKGHELVKPTTQSQVEPVRRALCKQVHHGLSPEAAVELLVEEDPHRVHAMGLVELEVVFERFPSGGPRLPGGEASSADHDEGRSVRERKLGRIVLG